MSVTQTTMEQSPSGDPHCSGCQAVLPPHATFCTSCGERVVKKNTLSLFQHEKDITARYRITTLVRRRPYVSLYFAIDNQQQRPVAIREIDMQELNAEARATACEVVQREYDLLRREHIPTVLPVIDLQHYAGRLYVIAGWPATPREKTAMTQLQTLQDVLQSGIGLPNMQVALTWIEQLCKALDNLHQHAIIPGDIDLQALILNGNTYESDFALMVSWLPASIRELLPPPPKISKTTNFSAPEVLQGIFEPSSDIYSLGAVLYLLLSGAPPEDAALRMQQRHLRSPGEVNPHISSSLDEFVMKALSLEPTERYQSGVEMAEALARLRSHTRVGRGPYARVARPPDGVGARGTLSREQADQPSRLVIQASPTMLPTVVEVKATNTRAFESSVRERKIDQIVSTDTVLITPLPETSLKAWQAAAEPSSDAAPQAEQNNVPTLTDEQVKPGQNDVMQLPLQRSPNANEGAGSSFVQNFKKRITGMLPAIAIPRSQLPKATPGVPASSIADPLDRGSASAIDTSSNKNTSARNTNYLPPKQGASDTELPGSQTGDPQGAPSFLKQLQRLFLGEQKHSTTTAATIETPLRVQPDQSYTIRIQLMGRNQSGNREAGMSDYLSTRDGTTDRRPNISAAKKGPHTGGLSTLVEGDLVYIEVRSALYQSYAYIVQQATVYIPAQGYAAEVTIPMQPLSSGPSGRRDRLHIFFMDEMRCPIYEKPFVVELFISHLVQPGREGHNVLTIPL